MRQLHGRGGTGAMGASAHIDSVRLFGQWHQFSYRKLATRTDFRLC